ncbi:MAG: hypothetical protein COB24_12615 [Hyphomicrobiales bacterium]|nr:MAG: hypothetical protein COB24_12615 [Hyphomicrobiales bacterium]
MAMTTNQLNQKDPRKPFPIRLNGEERTYLKNKAGKLALGTYIRAQILNNQSKPSSRAKATPCHDDVVLARILATLGAKNISQNLGLIAKATEQGTLYVDDQVKSEIKQACEDVQIMRYVLMSALGLINLEEDISLSTKFNKASSL